MSKLDWDFVPMWLRHAVDWSGEQPVVRASTTMPERTS